MLGNFLNHNIVERFEIKRDFYKTLKLSEAFSYHLNNLEIDSYIIDYNSYTLNQVLSLSEHIHDLNSLISILIYNPDTPGKEALSSLSYLFILEKMGDPEAFFNAINKNNRIFNRVEWPLSIEFHRSMDSVIKYQGIVLTLSVGGCYIKLKDSIKDLKSDDIIMTFNFKGFKFLSEGIIKRVEKYEDMGIAVEFQRVSPQTSVFLKQIIDEKILLKIMDNTE